MGVIDLEKTERNLKIILTLCLILLSLTATFAILNSQTHIFKNPDAATINLPSKEIHAKWFYEYSSDVDADQYYPVVCLRTGYKIIRNDGVSFLLGWKYDLINCSNNGRDIKVTYKLLDEDDFIIAEGIGTKYVKAKSVDTVQDTFVLSKKDYDRIFTSTWNINVGLYDTASMKKSNFSKYTEAWEVIKTGSYRYKIGWIKDYMEYIVNGFLYKEDDGLFNNMLYGNQWMAIIKKSGMKKDTKLMALLASMDVSFRKIPDFAIIENNEIYKNLAQDEKTKVNKWFKVQKIYGD